MLYDLKLRGRLVTSSDFVSGSIRFITRCKYSHIEFILDDGQTLGAHAQGGVLKRPPNYANFTRIRNFEIDVTQAQKDRSLGFAYKQIGKSYDFFATAGILVDRDWREEDKWFCSELFTRSLEVGGVINKLDYAINHVTPAHDLIILSALPNVRFLN